MQGEIDSLREKVAELESAQVATTNNVESKKEINNTADNVAETIKDVQDSKIDDGIEQSVLNEVESAFVSAPINSSANTTVSASESLSVGALIASVESNATQIKMPSYETEELKPLNAQSIESLPVDKEINKVGEKKDIQANINKKIKDSKEIEKVEPKVLENIESKNNITKTPEIKDLKKIPLASVFKEGEQFYKDKNYQKADEYLQVAVKGNYKPARGNYLLGEVAFEQKRYEDAIYYYKTSATRYDKADYMPRLMLHSAKSFEALKEKDNAKRFLETLIALYPTSSEAKEAKKLIK
ncbi:tetratricopeptide repeat protein [Helicobacter winghamensis ATCC BAA-430]|nr:tetratricopeptide repeat protein [Helicobacter winghamensis ATCC BAA-430]